MMTLFNEINARKIHGQRNVFEGILRNPIYYVIWIGTFAGQVVIIQFGGGFFQTAPLSAEQWLWCVVIGIGTLLWHQIVTSVPSKKLPKALVAGAGEPPDMASLLEMRDGTDEDREKRSGQILWIRGLTRLQTQIRVVNAFRLGLERREPSLAGPSAQRLREISRQLQLQHSQRSQTTSPTTPGAGPTKATTAAAAAFGKTASTSV